MSKASIQPAAPQPASLEQAHDLLSRCEFKLCQLASLGHLLGHTGNTPSEIKGEDLALLGAPIGDLAESIRNDTETANGEICEHMHAARGAR